MAWRAPTFDDLTAKLSEAEIEAFNQDVADVGTPAAALLEQTADMVRGYISANRAAVLADAEHSLPPMLIGPAMDYLAFDILKRLDIVPNEARAKAREAAQALFEKIAEGKITPEPGKAVEPGAPSAAAPSIAVKPPIL